MRRRQQVGAALSGTRNPKKLSKSLFFGAAFLAALALVPWLLYTEGRVPLWSTSVQEMADLTDRTAIEVEENVVNSTATSALEKERGSSRATTGVQELPSATQPNEIKGNQTSHDAITIQSGFQSAKESLDHDADSKGSTILPEPIGQKVVPLDSESIPEVGSPMNAITMNYFESAGDYVSQEAEESIFSDPDTKRIFSEKAAQAFVSKFTSSVLSSVVSPPGVQGPLSADSKTAKILPLMLLLNVTPPPKSNPLSPTKEGFVSWVLSFLTNRKESGKLTVGTFTAPPTQMTSAAFLPPVSDELEKVEGLKSWLHKVEAERAAKLKEWKNRRQMKNGKFKPRCHDAKLPSCYLTDEEISALRVTKRPAKPKHNVLTPPPPPDPEADDYESQIPLDKVGWPYLSANPRWTKSDRLRKDILAERKNSRGRVTPRMLELMQRRIMNKVEFSKGKFPESEWTNVVARAVNNGTRMWNRLVGLGLTESTGGNSALESTTTSPLLFIGIVSSPKHVSRRQACRESWLQYPEVQSGKVIYRFFVGLHRDISIDEDLLAEKEKRHDLEILQFMDSYYVLSLKTLAIAQFAALKSTSTFVMKTDDDTFIRVDEVLKRLLATNQTRLLFYGSLVKESRPVRSRRSKWYVSRMEWPGPKYPVWAHGVGYIFSSDIARLISDTYDSGNLEMFRLEDIGLSIWIDMLAKRMQVSYVHDTDIIFDGCKTGYVMAHYQLPPGLVCLWKQLEAGNGPRCCTS